MKKPFQVEDRIEVKGIKGDVMNISSLNFEVLEISTKEEHGQSTGVIVTFPNSIVFSEPVRNLNKGFKYIWDELTVKVPMDCDLVKNKQELYKIVNNIEIINETIANTKLIIPVIIEETVTPKNFPTIISLLFIGNVSNVSKVPLSLSPAVVSVAGYVAETVIAIIIKRKA